MKTIKLLLAQLLILSTITFAFAQNADYAPTQTTTTSSACTGLTVSMGVGSSDASTGGQVTVLQNFLKQNLGLSDANFIVTGYYGNVTKKFVAQWQTSKGISSIGRVGPATRVAINAAMCGGSSTQYIQSTTGATPTGLTDFGQSTNRSATPNRSSTTGTTQPYNTVYNSNPADGETVCVNGWCVTIPTKQTGAPRVDAQGRCYYEDTSFNVAKTVYQKGFVPYGQSCSSISKTVQCGSSWVSELSSSGYPYTRCEVLPNPAAASCRPVENKTRILSCPAGTKGWVTETAYSRCEPNAVSPTYTDWESQSLCTTTNKDPRWPTGSGAGGQVLAEGVVASCNLLESYGNTGCRGSTNGTTEDSPVLPTGKASGITSPFKMLDVGITGIKLDASTASKCWMESRSTGSKLIYGIPTSGLINFPGNEFDTLLCAVGNTVVAKNVSSYYSYITTNSSASTNKEDDEVAQTDRYGRCYVYGRSVGNDLKPDWYVLSSGQTMDLFPMTNAFNTQMCQPNTVTCRNGVLTSSNGKVISGTASNAVPTCAVTKTPPTSPVNSLICNSDGFNYNYKIGSKDIIVGSDLRPMLGIMKVGSFLGSYFGPIDYQPDPAGSEVFTAFLSSYVRAFQKGQGLPETGEWDQATRVKANSLCGVSNGFQSPIQSGPGTVGYSAGASCTLSTGEVIPHMGIASVFRRAHGDSGGTCNAYSSQATCKNGQLLSLGDLLTSEPKVSTAFPFAKCYEDTTPDDRLTVLLTSIYNEGLGRNADDAGFAYWKQQLKSGATTAVDLLNQFLRTRSAGQDSIGASSGALVTKEVSASNPVFRGTSANSTQIRFTIYYISGSPSEKIPQAFTTTASNGSWTISPGQSLRTGRYEYSVRAVSATNIYDGVLLDVGTLTVTNAAVDNYDCAATGTCGGNTGGTTNSNSNTNTNNSSNTCSNGATNYPGCSVCPVNQVLSGGQCVKKTVVDVIEAYSTRLRKTVTASDSGVQYWAGEIDAGRFTLSKLYTQFDITYLYKTILYYENPSQEPDVAGLTYWVTQVMNGAISLAGVKTSFCNIKPAAPACSNGALNNPTQSGTVAGVSTICPAFTRTISRGDEGDDVMQLQTFLKDVGYLGLDAVTGFFGDKTKAAVQNYQEDNGIATPTNKGYGVVGALTQEAILTDCRK